MKRSTVLTSLVLLSSSGGCALVDGLKDGTICISALDQGLFPDQVRGGDNNSSCQRDGSTFVNGDYLTSILTGETRTFVFRITQSAAGDSDALPSLSIKRSGNTGQTAVITLPAASDIHRTHGITDVKVTISVGANETAPGFDFDLEVRGVEGTASMPVHVLIQPTDLFGGNATDDLTIDPGASPTILLADCLKSDARWGRVVSIDPVSLKATKTVYSPPMRIPPQSCGSGDGNGGGGGGGGGGGCQIVSAAAPRSGACQSGCAYGLCPSAVALEAPLPNAPRTALVGFESKILRIDLSTGTATLAAQLHGAPLRIIPVSRDQAMVLESDTTNEPTIGMVGNAAVELVSLGGKPPLVSVEIPMIAASDMALVSPSTLAVLGKSSLTRVDLGQAGGMPKQEQVAAGFQESGLRIAPSPDHVSVVTSRFDRIDLSTGMITSPFPMPRGGNTTGPMFGDAFDALVFSAADRLIVEHALTVSGGGPQQRLAFLENIVRGSTTAAAVLTSNTFGGAVAYDATGQIAYVITNQGLYKIDPSTGSVTDTKMFAPNMGGPSPDHRRMVIEPSRTSALVLASVSNTTSIRRLDLSTGAFTDVLTNACVADFLLESDGHVLFLDIAQGGIFRFDPASPTRRTMVASVDLGNNGSGCLITSGGSNGLASLNTWGLAKAPGPNHQPAVWVSNLYGGLVSIDLGTMQKTTILPMSGGRLDISPDGGRAIFVDDLAALVSVDLTSGKRTRVALGNGVIDIVSGSGVIYAVGAMQMSGQQNVTALYETIRSP